MVKEIVGWGIVANVVFERDGEVGGGVGEGSGSSGGVGGGVECEGIVESVG